MSDLQVLTMVAREELEWGDHAVALARVARRLGWKVADVMEACDRAINPAGGWAS